MVQQIGEHLLTTWANCQSIGVAAARVWNSLATRRQYIAVTQSLQAATEKAASASVSISLNETPPPN